MNIRDYRISDSKVIESREVGDGRAIRRRRETLDGKFRFTTYERIDRPNIVVIKKSGENELFHRDKLANSIRYSVGHFFKSDIEVEKIINEIEDAIYDLGKSNIHSTEIGEIVLRVLSGSNDVAYVRFASVYYDFKTLDEFEKILADRKNMNQAQNLTEGEQGDEN